LERTRIVPSVTGANLSNYSVVVDDGTQYTITVTATSGSATQNTTVTLTLE
jgi:hypothetical protein